ncbi:hypothetical protein JCM4814A_14480 [Streptomyces phaeofaciens JCM 4814]|uniref:Uncharacterized protein n=1 Tax=Streptomyces phaeofaciens TaxID=68254 RepID=A0A918HM21_9ACTN|nr:hypothetical protein [Streptomyces phaeofaciens]GGT75033.1 hypothetical protein GCM10010226_61390 [Streptomyces phaeofaciens]
MSTARSGAPSSPAPDLALRQAPTTHAPLAGQLPPGSHDRVLCMVKGQSVDGNPYWYWLVGAEAWATAAFVDTGGARVPACADLFPQWKLLVSGSFSISGSIELTVS